MKVYGWSYRHVRYELPGAQAWVWYAWAKEHAQQGFGPVYKRTGPGYIKQEIKELLKPK